MTFESNPKQSHVFKANLPYWSSFVDVTRAHWSSAVDVTGTSTREGFAAE